MVASIDFRIVSVLCLALLSCLVEGTYFNVLDHGAKADGKSDWAKLIGTIQATTGTQYKEPEWLGFEKLIGFLLTGGGTFDG
ncbi:hypothetical protein IFM89_030040 [Coptis chinensis]|uniref:Uncharacterized protein n=1 Tax=Coptis chinensis TaxID=261450 RepID=A0A835IT39_9MAGN|nr:hypothetical protein IFM89_030040 [Coptis chinensis]